MVNMEKVDGMVNSAKWDLGYYSKKLCSHTTKRRVLLESLLELVDLTEVSGRIPDELKSEISDTIKRLRNIDKWICMHGDDLLCAQKRYAELCLYRGNLVAR